MPKAFVLMNAELGSEDSLVNELKKLESVKEVYQVYGVYDIVAQVESDTMDKVKETITWKLRKLNTLNPSQKNYLLISARIRQEIYYLCNCGNVANLAAVSRWAINSTNIL
jgi:DNA-binding Lrp family transcriptional regulator